MLFKGIATAVNLFEILVRSKIPLVLFSKLHFASIFNEFDSNREIEADKIYSYDIEKGFQRVELAKNKKPKTNYFLGEDLFAIAQQDFSSEQVKRSAKRFMRLALSPHIGSKPLQSRELFLRPK